MSQPVVGIDLGTSTSAVATVDEGGPRIIPNRRGRSLTPSLVGFAPDGIRVVGEGARAVAEEHPSDVASATKRFIGRRWTAELARSAKALVPYPLLEGPNGEVRVRIAGRVLPLTQISAMILGELKLDAEAHFGRPVSNCVITVPANFDDLQRAATREAAHIAGLNVLRLVNEPTAAAVAYGLTSNFRGRALVFDLGGGTFDVSILEVENGVFQVKATGGDPLLGGEDFDARVVQWLLEQVPSSHREAAARDSLSMQRLKVAAELAKRELSLSEAVLVSVSGLGDHRPGGALVDLEASLARAEFERLCEPLSERCLKTCQALMVEAQANPKDFDVVLMVGGMTRVPMVRRLVADYFGRPPVVGVNPDEVVALGAAVHAGELSARGGEALLIDVASHSIGVAVYGGGVRCLVAKNTPIPVVAREVFVPASAGQARARIEILQGDGEGGAEAAKLGEVLLSDLRAKARSEAPLEVTFELSSEGTLSVRAMDLSSGLSQAVKLEQRSELSAAEVKQLRAEQKAYHKKQSPPEVQAMRSFADLLARGEQLSRALSESAAPERADAQALVESVRRLVALGRSAFRSGNRQQMAEVTRRLTTLMETSAA
ncbi:MAG: Hsp70 family protein [Myxococcaceae bacterium]